jgi:hypothetical protein
VRRPGTPVDAAMSSAMAKQMPAYVRGHEAAPGVPLLTKGAATPHAEEKDRERTLAPSVKAAEGEKEEKTGVPQPIKRVPDVSGGGEMTKAVGHGGLTLNGETNASFNHSFTTAKVKETKGEGCEGCGSEDCVRMTGIIKSVYSVTTTVSLPKVSDFPDLTPCQQKRVRDGINNVLAPHEQRHVKAFKKYNGKVSTPFDITVCRGDFDASVQAIHDAEASQREADAQSLSDALDPFDFDVDLDCEEPKPKSKKKTAAATAADNESEVA